MTTTCQVRLAAEKTAMVVVDMQERLLAAMPEYARDRAVKNVGILLSLASRVGFSTVATEQYPKGLGHTVPEIRRAISGVQPLEKNSFSCCGASGFLDRLPAEKTRHVLVTGCETHVCVFQTVCDLLDSGFDVHVPSDAVCSRTESNWETGLRLMGKAGAVITSTETVVFDVLRVAGTEDFKFMSRLLK
ncbi:MAG: isochorismatase family protein [Nitrospinota bacterium]